MPERIDVRRAMIARQQFPLESPEIGPWQARAEVPPRVPPGAARREMAPLEVRR